MKKAIEPTPTDPMSVGEAATAMEDVDSGASSRNPWWFVPSLYFMQGLPVVVVQQLSVTMYKKMGVSNAEIGLWTSLIAWPWIAKMLWGPLVENNGTRRAWIVTMQALLIAALGFAAFSMGLANPAGDGRFTGSFLVASLAIFFVVAFLSATHDIAADGYYLLALRERQQAFFVGIRSAFFRLAMIFGTGMLVVIAGNMEKAGTPIPRTWVIALAIGTGVYAVLWVYGLFALPKPAADRMIQRVHVGRVLLSFLQILLMLVAVFLIGRLIVIGAAATNAALPKPVFTKSVELTPLFLESYLGQTDDAVRQRAIDLRAKAREPISMADALKQARETPRPFMVPDFIMPFYVQLLVALTIIGAAAWSTVKLFRRIGMGPAAREYFTRDRILPILGFILFYRFGESMLGKMASPFLLDPAEKGGVGVHTSAVGIISGTIGVLGLTLGGLLGGVTIAKYGIKRCIWPMVLCLNIPNLFYVWLAYRKPGSPLSDRIAEDKMPFMHLDVFNRDAGVLQWLGDFLVNIPSQIYNAFLLIGNAILDPVGQVILIDQFGYGFGFSAYMVYLMFISQGTRHRTSNYAISTGLMALGAMIAGITSGYLQEACVSWFGQQASYFWFFIGVLIFTIPGMLVLFLIPMDREDIKTRQIDID